MEVSYSDFPQTWGKSPETWGPSSVRHIIDKICQAGIRRIHWRLSCSGDFNYPTHVRGAGRAYATNVDFGECRGGIDFNEFDSLRVAVDYAHEKGMQLVAWFDQMDSHYSPDATSTLSQFLRDHPQFAHKLRRGKPPAERGRWTSSVSYPEVVEYRLDTLRELVNDYGVDGLYLVFVDQIGYEEPNVDSFRVRYGQDPNQIPEDDPRWIAHRAHEVLLPYLRRVKEVIQRSGRLVELIMEGQGSVVGSAKSLPDEPGWSDIPSFARANEIIQAARSTIIDERLADVLVYWSFADLEQAGEDLRGKISLGTRYRIWQRKTAEEFGARLEGAAARGVSLFTINEATPIEMFEQWDLIRHLFADTR